jgi:uncharacterized protein
VTLKHFKQLILSAVTLMAIAVFGYSLVSSWQEPQVQSQIDLYQTDLILQASEWQALQASNPNAPDVGSAAGVWSPIIGKNPVQEALEQYDAARKENQTNLDTLTAELKVKDSPSQTRSVTTLATSIQELKANQQKLAIKLGILQAQQGQAEAALKTWQSTLASEETSTAETALLLIGLWSEPPKILPEAEQQLQTGLRGWFRYHSLAQLYKLQQRFDALAQLQNQTQAQAQRAIQKLMVVGVLPTLGMIVGIGILLWALVQRLRQGQWWGSQLAGVWTTPWPGEIVWQVLIVTFFVLGQIAIPLVFSLLGWHTDPEHPRSYGFVILGNYICFALSGILVLWLSVRSFLPLPADWFQVRWQGRALLWGLGGYFVAIPSIVAVSLANQQLWQGRGGSNPLLPIALTGQDQIALACFLITAAIAAPIFEEIMFRGFLLPSLTRYMSPSAAIVLSSLIFAIAHLSLSEVLPLMVLGMILGFVYTRSRNLLSPILLHSLWNSGTLMTLFILGSGANAT